MTVFHVRLLGLRTDRNSQNSGQTSLGTPTTVHSIEYTVPPWHTWVITSEEPRGCRQYAMFEVNRSLYWYSSSGNCCQWRLVILGWDVLMIHSFLRLIGAAQRSRPSGFVCSLCLNQGDAALLLSLK